MRRVAFILVALIVVSVSAYGHTADEGNVSDMGATAPTVGAKPDAEPDAKPDAALSKPSTTLRKGLELQLEAAASLVNGVNFIANYRPFPRLAVGAGFGYYYLSTMYYSRVEYAIYANATYNFTLTKLSPFISAEIGYDDFSPFAEKNKSIYGGIVVGVQYSFSKAFAFKANIRAILGEYVYYNLEGVYFSVGLIYHF